MNGMNGRQSTALIHATDLDITVSVSVVTICMMGAITVVKVGLLAYATDTGLGNQTRAFYKYMKPAKTMLVDIGEFNGMKVHEDWYDYQIRTKGFPTNAEIDLFLDGLDLVFVCETPLNYYLFEEATRRGIKTVQQYNFEFIDYFMNRQLPQPTVFAGPTTWNVKLMSPSIFKNLALLPVPVDTSVLPKRSIHSATSFFHIAGRPAVHDRNGTFDFIEAARISRRQLADAEFLLYCQEPTNQMRQAADQAGVQIIEHVDNYADLYKQGDILILPRKYGGLCLPAQEAIGAGIPVIMPNISPNNDWLPKEWLVQTRRPVHGFRPRGVTIEVHHADVNHIARMMVNLHNDPAAVRQMHEKALEIGHLLSWDAMKIKYETFMGELCRI